MADVPYALAEGSPAIDAETQRENVSMNQSPMVAFADSTSAISAIQTKRRLPAIDGFHASDAIGLVVVTWGRTICVLLA